jgi:hypothetical protein
MLEISSETIIKLIIYSIIIFSLFMVFYAIRAFTKTVFLTKKQHKIITVELNGISNINMILSQYYSDKIDNNTLMPEDLEFITKIELQLNMIERYMLSVTDAVNSNIPIPEWHALLSSPKDYKNLKERFNEKN